MTYDFTTQNPPLQSRIAVGLARLATALRSNAWQSATPRGLTPTQGQILTFLERQPGATLGEVSEALAVRPATASEAVGALERKGLVVKSRRPGDARTLWLQLSAEGRTVAGEARQWPDFLAAAVETLGEEERRILLRALIGMIRALQERGEIPVAAMCVTCRFFRPNAHPDARRPHHCAYVDAPFGDVDLRLECPEHEAAEPAAAAETWRVFSSAASDAAGAAANDP